MEPSSRQARPKGKTPAERSVEFSDAQKRMKEEAAQRRQAAAKKGGDGARGRRVNAPRRTP